MGEVYRARDTKLKREVAIKILPAEWARDPERLARAQREAEVLASLNHPHIAQIYGREEVDGLPCLVLEFVDGETIHEKLTAGPIPVEEALEIARQIADALGAAHERGIVHRDLKPANVKITPDGQVKVLDFGLAKTLDQAVADMSHSPTLAGSMTGAGIILGTSGYISPEQIKGKTADARSDIWSFGIVLYEMLTGKAPFEGETIMEMLSAVLKGEPDWSALPAKTPPAIRSLLRRCLQKDRTRRLRDIADARFQIEEVLSEPVHVGSAIVTQVASRRWPLWLLALPAAIIVSVVATGLYFQATRPEQPETRLQIVTPPTSSFPSFAISPDGRKLVFDSVSEGKNQLWLRSLESETPRPLAGTENASFPFWAPDSEQFGFFADGKLKRIDINGGAAQTISDAGLGIGGAWNADGTILFTPSSTTPLYRVSANGGKATPVTEVERPRQASHRFPNFLPDGRHFLFFAAGTGGGQGVYAGSLDNKEIVRLFDAESAAVFVMPDRLFFVRQGTLWSQRFDLKQLLPIGETTPIMQELSPGWGAVGNAPFSVSRGLIAYRTGQDKRHLIWYDRSGKQIGTVGDPDKVQVYDARLSPDGLNVAVGRVVGGNFDVWLMDTVRGVLRRLTSDPGIDGGPVWSPDGRRLAFYSRRNGPMNLYVRSAAAGGDDEHLLASSENNAPTDWSPDGKFILFGTQSSKTSGDIWALPLEGERKPFPVLQTAFEETAARFSPDGRWVAYQSNESGRDEIYVQPFRGTEGSTQISISGGTVAQWRSDGKEIFYAGADNRLMAAPVTLNGSKIETGNPVPLFLMRPASTYYAARDGQRFLVNAPTENAAPITLILNWAGAKK